MNTSTISHEDLWREICFLLGTHIKQNSDEKSFQHEIVHALEKLGWSRYRKEINEQLQIPIGSAKTLIPDIVVSSNETGDHLFVIEVKKPHTAIHSATPQLTSYMRQCKCELGLVISNKIYVFWDDPSCKQDSILLIDQITIDKDDHISGYEFVKAFSRASFADNNKKYIVERKNTLQERRVLEDAKAHIQTDSFNSSVLDFICSEIQADFQFSEHLLTILRRDIDLQITVKKIQEQPVADRPHRSQESPSGTNRASLKDYSPYSIALDGKVISSNVKKADLGMQISKVLINRGISPEDFALLKGDRSSSYCLLKQESEILDKERKKYGINVLTYQGKKYCASRNWGDNNIPKFIAFLNDHFPSVKAFKT